MVKIAAFIIPNGKIRLKIINLKNEVKKKFGLQPYLLHPPHCTLLTMNVSNKFLTKKKLFHNLKIKTRNKAILNIRKKNIFFNDPITKGNTIYFKIQKTFFLNILQLNLLNIFSKYRIKTKSKFKYKWMDKNLKRYGYPFIGKTWIPHFTIASLKNVDLNKEKKFIKNFLSKKNNFKETVKKIYIYKISGEKHIYLWSIDIKLIK